MAKESLMPLWWYSRCKTQPVQSKYDTEVAVVHRQLKRHLTIDKDLFSSYRRSFVTLILRYRKSWSLVFKLWLSFTDDSEIKAVRVEFGVHFGSRCQPSSSASLIIEMLLDLHGLTWLREFEGLIAMVLEWGFSGSSVNRVFFLFISASVAVDAVRRRDRVHRRALFTGGMGRMWGVGQTGPGLACVVVELHQAEDQVWGHQLKGVRRIRDDIPFGTLALVV